MTVAGLPAARHDAVAMRAALVTALTMIAQQVAGKAARDALFLSHFEVVHLPKVVMASSLLSVVTVFAVSKLLISRGPARLVPLIFTLSALLSLIEWWLYPGQPRLAALLLYLHVGALGATLISGFWSVVNERFDPHAAKRSIVRIGAAATLGGIVGGVIAARVTALADTRSILLALACMQLICVVGVRGIGKPRYPAPFSGPAGVTSGVQALIGSGYLRRMGLLAMLVLILGGFLDYALKSGAAVQLGGGESLVAFFATFYAAIGVVTFAVQVVLGPWMLNRFGLGGAISTLPAVVIAGGVLAALVDEFRGYVVLKAAEAVFANSLFRAGFELLYTPLPVGHKRSTKALIDVGGNRLGDMLAGAMLLALLAVVPQAPSTVVAGLAAATGAVVLWLTAGLYRRYVDRLASNLRAGSVTMDVLAVSDATTRRVFAETTAAAERQMMIERIRELERDRGAAGNAVGHESKLRAVADLVSGDAERIRATLTGAQIDARMTPLLIPLLGHSRLADEVRLELRWLAPRIIGQLTDALLDPDLPVTTRGRLPGVMEVMHSPRAVDGLMQGLRGGEFAVRYSCARALSRMIQRSPDLMIVPEAVFAIAEAELAADDEVWHRQTHHSAGHLIGVDEAAADERVNPSLQHLFTVLSLTLDGTALDSALRSLIGDDAAARGTALEYLENVLPMPVRNALWRRLGVSGPIAHSRRSRADLVVEMERPATKSPAGDSDPC